MIDEVNNSEQVIVVAGTLQAFAECAEAVAATTKKLEKAAILGRYLESLSDSDLDSRGAILCRASIRIDRCTHDECRRQHHQCCFE